MNKKPIINIYINAAKAFYFPGEKYSATILLDILDKINCNKMKIIAKGKQIINAQQRNKYENEEQGQKRYESSSSSGDSSSDSDDGRLPGQLPEESPIVKINDKKSIFKVTKEILISQNKYISAGKQSFPFEIELPKDIPGTFLYLEKNIYAEVAYSVKVKIEEINLKVIVPIVIRQKEEIFGYPSFNSFNRKVYGCCCIAGETTIKLTASDKFTKTGESIKLAVKINNQTNTTTTPVTLEIYRKLILKLGNKKIRVTKIVGGYHGKRIISAREEFTKKIHVAIETDNYLSEHIQETKAYKIFKHKEIIPYLFQSIISENITCEFEVYAESQYANLTNDDLGVFLSVLIYPIEDGVISKTVMNIAKAFVNGILNKKFFLKGENLIKKEEKKEEQKEKEKIKKPKTKKKIYQESFGDKESIKFENNIFKKIMNKKNKENINSEEEEEEDEKEDFNINKKNSGIKNNNSNINNMNGDYIDNNKNMMINNNNMNANLINTNSGFNNINNNNDKLKDSKNLNSEEISFGTSSKDKVNYFNNNMNDTASNIKKNFNQGFLNDPLDEQMSDDEK